MPYADAAAMATMPPRCGDIAVSAMNAAVPLLIAAAAAAVSLPLRLSMPFRRH